MNELLTEMTQVGASYVFMHAQCRVFRCFSVHEEFLENVRKHQCRWRVFSNEKAVFRSIQINPEVA